MTATLEQLEGRVAHCRCGRTKPSVEVQGNNFFVYQGAGSMASTQCRKCGYYESAHEYDASRVRPKPRDCNYEPTPEGKEFDSFWDGCGNTD